MIFYNMSHTKGADGKYHIAGKKYEMLIGTRAQVWHGTAYKTAGGLTKGHLMQNKAGRIVSRAKHSTAKKEMRLLKHGYGTKKGKFGYVKVGSRRSRSSKRSQKGGAGMAPLSPADVSAPTVIEDVVAQVFSPLDRALTGGRRRSRSQKGGAGMAPLSPADVSAPSMIADVVPQQFSPLDRALTGGRRRSRSAKRSQRGGLPYGSAFSPADAMSSGIDGQGITDYAAHGSTDVQIAAGMAGGRRRARSARRSRAAKRSRSARRARSAKRSRASRRSRGASRARSLALRGGTADRRSFGFPVAPSSPTISALRA